MRFPLSFRLLLSVLFLQTVYPAILNGANGANEANGANRANRANRDNAEDGSDKRPSTSSASVIPSPPAFDSFDSLVSLPSFVFSPSPASLASSASSDSIPSLPSLVSSDSSDASDSLPSLPSSPSSVASSSPSSIVPSEPSSSSPWSMFRFFFSHNPFSFRSKNKEIVKNVESDVKDKNDLSLTEDARIETLPTTTIKEGMTFDEWKKANPLPPSDVLFQNAQMESIQQYVQLALNKYNQEVDDGTWTKIEEWKIESMEETIRRIAPSETEEIAVHCIEAGNSPLAEGNEPNAINQPNGSAPFMELKQFFIDMYVNLVETDTQTDGHDEQDKPKETSEAFFVTELQPLLMYFKDCLKLVSSLDYAQRHTSAEVDNAAKNLSYAIYYLNVARFYAFGADNVFYSTVDETVKFLRTVNFDMPTVVNT